MDIDLYCDVCNCKFTIVKTQNEFEILIDNYIKIIEQRMINITEKEMLLLWEDIFQLDALILHPNKKPYLCPANKCKICICENCILNMEKYGFINKSTKLNRCIECCSIK